MNGWLLLLGFSLLKIWRSPPKEGALNLWDLAAGVKEKRPHLPVEEGIRRAREAARLDHHTGAS